MASSVFFKFKSQKEPTRVEFDGTGISVFELKREIIIKSGLGDGTDFDLFITDDNGDVYDDDTEIIPRSTTVIARRQPATKPGAGRAARYVSGKMPVSAKNAGRKEQTAKSSASKTTSSAINQMNEAMTEEEKMQAMFAAQGEQWNAQQEKMSHHQPSFQPGQKRPANVPDHDPPNGYICYRCGNKGHWIQLCPTNDDPEFDNRPRVKRTTGIPRSFLQKVDKAAVLAQSEGDESKRPSGIMVNAEGDFVIAEADKATWKKFQAKANTSSAKTNGANALADKEIQERGLECSIDKKMFKEPMKTPCCQKTFCNDCITNALIESDFVCPNCELGDVLIDDLTPDEEMAEKIKAYLQEKEEEKEAAEKAAQEAQESTTPVVPSTEEVQPEDKVEGTSVEVKSEAEKQGEAEVKPASVTAKSKSPTPMPASKAKSPPTGPKSMTPQTDGNGSPPADGKPADGAVSKKRPADELLENPKIPKGPRAMQNQMNNQQQQQTMPNMMNGMNMGMMNMMPNMMGMGMGMPMMPNMMMGGFNNGFNNGGNFNNGGFNNFNNGGGGWDMGMGMGMGMGMNNMNSFGMPFGNNGGGAQGEEDAYFRKPVNPHRHQNKQRRPRPSDFREL
ncbi:DWNN domain-containing protein [Emericellopsis atlantica]|uniref:DWNN domain-containing protein n=1 Tax=Emericellopsis atlantica TaxID=2614577 RepID=A0A9P8CME0_9HYPO|nr:DWNN domain-containing protein [Emericellopsis atlantica]KAG9252012.1 DWNN domain-containing protein [Emericellopsis atlantica]